MNAALDEFYARKRREFGAQFDDTDLRNAPSIVRSLFGTDTRIIIETRYPSGATLREVGRIGVTTGWRPSFMLMFRRTDSGSSNLIGATETETPEGTIYRSVVAVQDPDNRHYYATDENGRTWSRENGRVMAPASSWGTYTEAPEEVAS